MDVLLLEDLEALEVSEGLAFAALKDQVLEIFFSFLAGGSGIHFWDYCRF